MYRRLKAWMCVLRLLLYCPLAFAQIPVEFFAGHKKSTADIMFFKFIKNDEGQNTRFLFFNRNRASIDYTMTPNSSLPQFGFTEALSYNHEKWAGFGPVAVVSLLNRGVYPKAGIQYARLRKESTIFGWLVTETLRQPFVDFFFMARYTPALNSTLHLFTQVELINAFPTSSQNAYSFTQRLRLGIKRKAFQIGTGLDVVHLGRSEFTRTENLGGFIRYEF